MKNVVTPLALAGILLATALGAALAEPSGFLATIHRHTTLTSTVTYDGNMNPYAVVVAPVSAGKVSKGDVLVTNFNNVSNLQGTGFTIVDYDPSTAKTALFADIPPHLAGCPGGVGLTTAMTMLSSGWVIVGSTPSTDGTTRTKGDGCLIVLDSTGNVVATWHDANIDDPWGNMAVVDRGSTATLFVSMAGFGVPGPEVVDPASGFPVTVAKATVLRIDLSIGSGGPPTVRSETVIASGFGQRADRDAFLIGPTGLALGPQDTLFVSDALGNRIAKIPQASTRTTSDGTGETLTQGGLLRRPLAMTIAPNGDLLVINATNGQVVEIDATTGTQLYAQWIDNDQAQSPPGNGDLFGIAMAPDGKGFYYVEDDVNALMEATQ